MLVQVMIVIVQYMHDGSDDEDEEKDSKTIIDDELNFRICNKDFHTGQ